MKAQHFGKTSHPPEKKNNQTKQKGKHSIKQQQLPTNDMPNKNTGKGPRNKIRVETPPVDGIGFLPTAVSTSCRGQKSPLRVETFPGSRRPSGRCVLIRCLFGMCCTRNCCFSFYINVFLLFANLILEVNIQERKKDEYINLPIWSGLLTYGLQLKAGI